MQSYIYTQTTDMKKLYIALVLIIVCSFTIRAEEGMWLPQLLQSLNEKDMKKQGLKLNTADIYSINKGSLKDAIVSFGGFCTAEVISDQGLILTNHHCGYDAVQNHSTIEHNYIQNGFWSKNKSEELTNPGLTATFIISIEEVTRNILQNTEGLSEKKRQSVIDKNIETYSKNVAKETFQEVLIKPFFEGNRYFLFVTETYKDIRLVGAPPASIGNFGKDTDNWMWPRHTGDFSLFRIYANKYNQPTEYAEDNIPYKPKKVLNISLDGVQENDFTMVMGFPGRTNEYLHSASVQLTATILNPVKISIRKTTLNIMKDYMMKDETINIQYAVKYSKIENVYKKSQGEILGLQSKKVVAKKISYEFEFQKRVMANAVWKEKYGTLLNEIDSAYTEIGLFIYARDVHNEILSKIELITVASQLNSIIPPYEKNDTAAYRKAKEKATEVVKGLYAEYNPTVDKKLFEALMDMYLKDMQAENIAPELSKLYKTYNNNFINLSKYMYLLSALSDSNQVYRWLSLPADELVKKLKEDKAVVLTRDFQKIFAEKINLKIPKMQARINNLQRRYMQAQVEVFKEKTFYADANSTLRLSYGKAKNYQPRDGVQYQLYTYLDGVMEKYIPGNYEFDVPEKLIELYNAKDYGQYGDKGKQPVCFIGTNHTTGGNSGSPALDAYGNLIGLNFDRVWEGTMSDINYDPSICRNIMVDIRYVTFIIDKFADAKNIISELRFVHPKLKK